MQFNLEPEFQKAEEKLIIVKARKHIAETKKLQALTGEKKSALVISSNDGALASTIKNAGGKNSGNLDLKVIKMLQDPDKQK